ncbi:MAG: DNA replication and repair protein RecF [Simkaniaceae bacterium]
MHLRLKNFRNYTDFKVAFEEDINWIIGPNASGKTNLLEAIHLISTGRSFRTPYLRELIQHGEKAFLIDLTFEKEGLKQQIRLYYDGERKSLRINNQEYTHFTPLFGTLPSTLFTPSDIMLIEGGPKYRRRYLNVLLAQSDPLYIQHLLRYTRALKQRNQLLKQGALTSIGVWEHEMIRSANYLMGERQRILSIIAEKAAPLLKQLTPVREELSLKYQPSLLENDPQFFQKTRAKELKAGLTLYGPHLDELSIEINGKSAKSFGSEGQKRSSVAALKIAEYQIMKEKMGTVLFGLDDFGAQLDKERISSLKNILINLKPSIVTAPTALESQEKAPILLSI